MLSLSAPFVKTTREWAARSPRRSADAAARRFAREHMVAVILAPNDDAVIYLYDVANDRVARTVEKNPRWVA